MSRCWQEHRQTPHHDMSSPYFSTALWWDGEYHLSHRLKMQPFQDKLFDKQKKVRVQSTGPARGEATAKDGGIIKYEWEWAALTCKLQASVCHHYQADGQGEVIPATHSSANKTHRPCLCNWYTNRSDGGGGVGSDKRGQVQPWPWNGPAW